MHGIKTRVVMALVGFAAVAVSALALAVPANAAVYDEVYGCTPTQNWDAGFIGACNNLWWNADPNHRSARLNFGFVTYNDTTAYRNTGVTYAQSTDGTKKTYTYYCWYDNGTSSGSLGTLTLGGGYPTYHDYTPQFGVNGWNPCAGYKGMIVNIFGWYGGSAHIKTEVWVNGYDSPHAVRGYECTYPSEVYASCQ